MEHDPYAEGADAYLAGKPESANPYDLDVAEDASMSWNDGWNAQADAALEDAVELED